MSYAKIIYSLSEQGRKASILSGGDGREEQTITVGRDDPDFTRCVQRGAVESDGSVVLKVWAYVQKFDAPATVGSVLALLDELDARKVAEEAAKVEEKRQATLTVLTGRKTTKKTDRFGVNREGEQVNSSLFASALASWEVADWPYYSDPTVKESPEAIAWEAELEAAKQAAIDAALAEARAQLPELLAKEQAEREAKEAKAAALAARKAALGVEATDYLCRIEDGALANVPVWESHKRGKNWFATVAPSPSSPGGLARDFAAKARGDLYYMLPSLSVGDAVEFGADYYSGGGRKNADRWYGFVVAVTGDALLLRPCGTGKAAHKAGEAWAKTHGPTPVEDAVEQGLRCINGEGAIIPSDN